jgi:hypothetical protein
MANELVRGVFADPVHFETNQRMAKALCAASLFPEHMRNIPDALIVLEMAQRIGTSPLLVAQQLYVVHGKPAWSGQYCIAAVNASGRFDTLKFEVTGKGDDKQCIAWAFDKKGARIEGPPISIKMAKAEGWYSRNGSKWKTMEDLMLRYRAAAFFARLYTPDLLMGLYTREEREDIGAEELPPITVSEVIESPKQTKPEPEPEPAAKQAEQAVDENEQELRQTFSDDGIPGLE